MGDTEGETLLFLSLDLKNGLSDICERCAKVVVGRVGYIEKGEIEKAGKKARELLKKADRLKKEVDERTDEEF